MRDDNSMAFRTLLPLGRAQWSFRPAADGQMGCIMKLYREWQISGDNEFLKQHWPGAKRALEFAGTHRDADKDDLMEWQQHNTYDIEFYGPNPMMSTLYLGALRHGQESADGEVRRSRLVRWHGARWPNPIPIRRGCLSDQVLGAWFAEVIGLDVQLAEGRSSEAAVRLFRRGLDGD